MLELTHEDIIRTLDTLRGSKTYDYVVVDMNLKISKEFMEILGRMNRIILVQDGGETSNSKFARTMEAMEILENQTKINVTGAMSVVYNRFSSSKSSRGRWGSGDAAEAREARVARIRARKALDGRRATDPGDEAVVKL